MSDEQYKDFKRELSKKSAFKDFAKALENHYSDKGGHKKRSDYWKQVRKDENQRKETKGSSR